MADLIRFTLVLLLLVVLIFLQGTRFLDFRGINPNLILIFFSGLILAPFLEKRIRLNYLLTLLIFSFFIGSFLFDFWIVPWLILLVLIAASRFLKKFLTGHSLVDFFAVIGASIFLLYFILNVLSRGVWGWSSILGETAYNLILGAIFWRFLQFFEKHIP